MSLGIVFNHYKPYRNDWAMYHTLDQGEWDHHRHNSLLSFSTCCRLVTLKNHDPFVGTKMQNEWKLMVYLKLVI